jgi:hypothetical protein
MRSIAVQWSATATVSGSLSAARRITRKRSASGKMSYFRRNGASASDRRRSKSHYFFNSAAQFCTTVMEPAC